MEGAHKGFSDVLQRMSEKPSCFMFVVCLFSRKDICGVGERNFSVVLVFEAALPVSFFFHGFQVCFGDICGGEGDDAGDGYHYTLLRVYARHSAHNTFEGPLRHSYHASGLVVYLLWCHAVRFRYGSIDYAYEVLHLTEWHRHYAVQPVMVFPCMVKGKVHIWYRLRTFRVAVGKGTHLSIRTIYKEYCWRARNLRPVPYSLNDRTPAFHRQERKSTGLRHQFRSLLCTAIRRTQHIPSVARQFASLGLQNVLYGQSLPLAQRIIKQ